MFDRLSPRPIVAWQRRLGRDADVLTQRGSWEREGTPLRLFLGTSRLAGRKNQVAPLSLGSLDSVVLCGTIVKIYRWTRRCGGWVSSLQAAIADWVGMPPAETLGARYFMENYAEELQLLVELERQHDELLRQLDELDKRVEAVLVVWQAARTSARPWVPGARG